jgi:hypothetical protein
LRVRGRIEAVLDFAKTNNWRAEGENPAAWSGNLEHALPPPRKIAKVAHHAALPGKSCRHSWPSRRPARAWQHRHEVITAKWSEIDFANAVWTRPADHMKAGVEHRVPLSDAALQIRKTLPREDGNPHVFVGTRRGSGLSNMTMTELLKRMERTDITMATLHMESVAAELVSSPGSVAAPQRSLFQTDSHAIRFILPPSWALRSGSAVAFCQSVKW